MITSTHSDKACTDKGGHVIQGGYQPGLVAAAPG